MDYSDILKQLESLKNAVETKIKDRVNLPPTTIKSSKDKLEEALDSIATSAKVAVKGFDIKPLPESRIKQDPVLPRLTDRQKKLLKTQVNRDNLPPLPDMPDHLTVPLPKKKSKLNHLQAVAAHLRSLYNEPGISLAHTQFLIINGFSMCDLSKAVAQKQKIERTISNSGMATETAQLLKRASQQIAALNEQYDAEKRAFELKTYTIKKEKDELAALVAAARGKDARKATEAEQLLSAFFDETAPTQEEIMMPEEVPDAIQEINAKKDEQAKRMAKYAELQTENDKFVAAQLAAYNSLLLKDKMPVQDKPKPMPPMDPEIIRKMEPLIKQKRKSRFDVMPESTPVTGSTSKKARLEDEQQLEIYENRPVDKIQEKTIWLDRLGYELDKLDAFSDDVLVQTKKNLVNGHYDLVDAILGLDKICKRSRLLRTQGTGLDQKVSPPSIPSTLKYIYDQTAQHNFDLDAMPLSNNHRKLLKKAQEVMARDPSDFYDQARTRAWRPINNPNADPVFDLTNLNPDDFQEITLVELLDGQEGRTLRFRNDIDAADLNIFRTFSAPIVEGDNPNADKLERIYGAQINDTEMEDNDLFE